MHDPGGAELVLLETTDFVLLDVTIDVFEVPVELREELDDAACELDEVARELDEVARVLDDVARELDEVARVLDEEDVVEERLVVLVTRVELEAATVDELLTLEELGLELELFVDELVAAALLEGALAQTS